MDNSPPSSMPSVPATAATEPLSFYEDVLDLHRSALPRGFQGPAALLCAAATSASMLAVDWCVMVYYQIEEACRKRNAAKNA